MNAKKFNQVKIEEILSVLGHFPAKISGDDVWFFNPFALETNSSFKVSRSKNLWFLFSEGVGGNCVDFVQKYLNCSISEVLSWADQQNFSSFHQHNLISESRNYEITEVSKIQNWNLKKYLLQRGLSSKVYPYAREIKFTINQKKMYAIGFENCSHGWELRNSFYKGSLLKKDISLIENFGKEVLVFEGFMDALSYIEITENIESDLLILNSVAMVDRAIEKLKSYEKIVLFLDNDVSGEKTKQQIETKVENVENGSILYRDYKDLNEFVKQRKAW